MCKLHSPALRPCVNSFSQESRYMCDRIKPVYLNLTFSVVLMLNLVH